MEMYDKDIPPRNFALLVYIIPGVNEYVPA